MAGGQLPSRRRRLGLGKELLLALAPTATVLALVEALSNQRLLFKGTNVNVETFRGTVQLSGFVDSPQNAARAADIARRVEGVRDVRNALIVK